MPVYTPQNMSIMHPGRTITLVSMSVYTPQNLEHMLQACCKIEKLGNKVSGNYSCHACWSARVVGRLYAQSSCL